MKKLIAGLGATVLALGVAGSASAFVSITGIKDSSSAMSTLTSTITALVSNINTIGALNSVVSGGSSGGNSITTGDSQKTVSVKTGGASAATLVDTTSNDSQDTFTYDAGGPDDAISTVEDDSSATVENTDTLDKDIDNVNATEVLNDVAAGSESGATALTAGDSVETATVETGTSGAAAGVVQKFNVIKEMITRMVKFKGL